MIQLKNENQSVNKSQLFCADAKENSIEKHLVYFNRVSSDIQSCSLMYFKSIIVTILPIWDILHVCNCGNC